MKPLFRVVDLLAFLLGWIATYTLARLDAPLGWFGGLPMCLWMLAHWRLSDWSDRLTKLEEQKLRTAELDELSPPAAEPPLELPAQRLMAVGFQFVTVEPGARATVQVSPQRHFSPRELKVPSSIGQHFTIEQIEVGAQSVLESPAPGECFSELAIKPGLDWPPVRIGETISIRVRNNSQQPRQFGAMMIGVGTRGEETITIARREFVRLVRCEAELALRDGREEARRE